MYTNSPDGHFVIDRLADAQVAFASARSSHGVKFARAIGQMLADMTTDASTPSFVAEERL
jgi:sarcosine oxidase